MSVGAPNFVWLAVVLLLLSGCFLAGFLVARRRYRSRGGG
jgi:hypothetical protein